MSATNAQAAEALFAEASRCRRCPRMARRSAVLGPSCGTLSAEVLFVGEAPGRLGADRSRVPFRGDRSGENFEALLAHLDLSRDEVFITNAVLCCPVAGGCNNRPTAAEMSDCSPFLRRTIELVSPTVVVTLGAVALAAVGRMLGFRRRLSAAVGRAIEGQGWCVVPLYHPSPRVTNSRRPLGQQLRDIEAVTAALSAGRRAGRAEHGRPGRRPHASANRRPDRSSV